MNKKTIMISALAALAISTAAHSKMAVMPPAEYANEKVQVTKAFSNWRDALASGKPENIVKLYAEDAMLLATLAKDPIDNQKDRAEYFTGLMKKPALKATVNQEHIRILDEDDAVVSGVYTFSFKEGDKVVEVPARYSFVLEKTEGKWMIVEHHSSKVPTL